uniref:Putative terminase n=1 Tax=viral metagenome TaxID=1070528 RepID=A0A6H1ZXS0_9ZZZZ
MPVEIISPMSMLDAMRLLMSDRILMMQTMLKIEDKARDLVPFILNPIQHDMIAKATIRDVLVKPAQVGASTVQIADFMLDILTIPGTTAVIISYDEFITGRLLRKARVFYNMLKERIPSIPKMDHNSTYEMTFPDVNGSFYIGSARSFTFGRGEKIDDLLLDEYGFWQPGDAERIFASALQRVPLLPKTKVRILSTPNGEDNDFCETFRAAVEGKAIGKSVFKAHFYPWFIHPEYILTPDSPFCLPGDDEPELHNLLPEETALIQNFNVSYNQLRWRRYKQAEMGSLRRSGNTTLLFSQEYPEDQETCFLSAGSQAHDADTVNMKIRECYPAPDHISVVNPKNGQSVGVDIWERPESSQGYILSIDPGKAKSSESVAHIWYFTEGYIDQDKLEVSPRFKHCATLAGMYEEWEMAEFCMALGKFYGDAVIAPEDNLDTVSHLRTYPELYYREDLKDGKITKAIGWQTNGKTKPYMIGDISRHLDHIECYDIRFWSQCKNTRRDSSNKTGYVNVGSIDHYMAGGIAIVCRNAMPSAKGLVGSCGWDDDWGKD